MRQRLWHSLLSLAAVLFAGAVGARAGWLEDTGYTALSARVSLNGGANLSVLQVEASLTPDGRTYMVDTTAGMFQGKSFTDLTGNGLASWHASKVGEYYYGNTTSMARSLDDISLQYVSSYTSDSLHAGAPATTYPELLTGMDLMTHAWASSAGQTATLARFDYQIALSNIVAVVGVSNVEQSGGVWSGFDIPVQMAQSYNAIAVGSSDGYTSHGPISDGSTPLDLVCPAQWAGTGANGKSSWATARISSAAALLRSQARANGWAGGEDPRVIRAVLMASAVKLGPRTNVVINSSGTLGTINAWAKGDPATSADDANHPLDYYQGAGQLNVDQAYDILVSGQQAPAPTAPVYRTGWDWRQIGVSGQATYFFDVYSPADSFSAILTWYADARKSGANWIESITSQNLNLYLYAVEDGSFVVPGQSLQASTSTVDNVEHIWLTGLSPGRYCLKVTGGSVAWEYGLAWQTIGGDPAEVVAARVFYNHSAWDGNNPAANASDDAAIATDKTALLPGQTSSFANVITYSKGINGIMVDIVGMTGTPTAADFTIQYSGVSNGALLTDYTAQAGAGGAPAGVTVVPGGGADGSSRVKLIFTSFTANEWGTGVNRNSRWMQVTVLANANTGLAAPYVFYFGLAIADTGNSTSNFQVTAADQSLIRANPRTALNPAPIDFKYDINRDAAVTAADQALARTYVTSTLNNLLKYATTAP